MTRARVVRQYGNWPLRYKAQLSTQPGIWFDAYLGGAVTLWGAKRIARRAAQRATPGPAVWWSESEEAR